MQRGDLLLGRYEVLSRIGAGGYGVIYKARQTSTGQLVAVKMLLTNTESNPAEFEEETGRFVREMRLIGRLSHPHIVQLIDSGVERGQRLMVLEFVDGENLGTLLKLNGPMAPGIVKRVMMQVLDALSEAHENGVIHRDLKPQNIMVTGPERRPNVKVLDFGIAGIADDAKRDEEYQTLTQNGSIPGTPSYMAPEQIRTGESSPASDLYALGLIMFECLSGKRAVSGESVGDICVKQVTEPVTLPAGLLDSPFAPIIERACEKQPGRRYQSAEEMLSALEALGGGGLNSASSVIVSGTFDEMKTQRSAPQVMLEQASHQAPRRDRRLGLLLALVFAFVLLGSGFATWFLLIRAPSEETEERGGEAKGSMEKPRASDPQAAEPTAAKAENEPVEEKEEPVIKALLAEGQGLQLAQSSCVGCAGLFYASTPVMVWQLESKPQAKVSLGDEVLCERTPCEVSLAKGEHRLRFAARGYHSKEVRLDVVKPKVKVKLSKVRTRPEQGDSTRIPEL